MTEPPTGCPWCPDGHEDPERRRWAVYVDMVNLDHDGQSVRLIVAKTGSQHVAESDAEWARQALNDHHLAAVRADERAKVLAEVARLDASAPRWAGYEKADVAYRVALCDMADVVRAAMDGKTPEPRHDIVRFYFSDADPVAECGCGWRSVGDSAVDAFRAWWRHSMAEEDRAESEPTP